MKHVLATLALIPTASISASADAPYIRVQITDIYNHIETHDYAPGATISLQSFNNTHILVNIWASDGTSSIGPLDFAGSTDQPLNVFVGVGAFPTVQTDLNEVAGNLAGMTVGSGIAAYVRFAGAINGSLTAALNAAEVFRFELGGAVNAGIQCTQTGTAIGHVRSSGGITSSGSIVATNGDIGNIKALGDSDILGPIEAPNGSIVSVEAPGNVLGSAAQLIVKAKYGVDLVQARTLNGNVTTNYGNSTGGDLQLLEVKRVLNDAQHADLNGIVTASAIQGTALGSPGIVVEDDVAGTIHVDHSVKRPITIGGSIKSTALLWVGDDLKDGTNSSDPTLSMASGGLDGQVIINGNNGVYSPWASAWVGHVKVGTKTISPGAYVDTDLGDGAVALARFTVHKEACIPANGADLSTVPSTVTLRHYGPILLAPNSTVYPHVLIERRPYAGGSWAIVVNDFETDSVSGRDLVIKPKSGKAFLADSEYKFTHTPPGGGPSPSAYGYLKCDQVSTNPVLRTGTDTDGKYEYHFFIKP